MSHALLLSLAIAAITLLSWTSQWFWPSWIMDLASSFQLQYAIANLLLWLLLLRLQLQQRRTKALYLGLIIGLACLSFQIAMLSQWYRPSPAVAVAPSAQASTQSLKIISTNIYPGIEDYGPLLQFIRQERPDLVLLQEATALSLKEMGSLADQLPYSLHKVPPGPRRSGEKYAPKGTALFSRFPLVAQPSKANSPEDRAGLLARIQLEPSPSAVKPPEWFQLFVVHALVPIRPSFYRQRNDQLSALFAVAQTSSLPTIAMGDFNTAIWSPQLDASKTNPLRPVRQGFGIVPTWRPNLVFPKGLQWLGNLFWVPIDHCYISSDIAPQDFRSGPDVNSDHLPLIVELNIPLGGDDPSRPITHNP
jgi:endonuclease/exonuclease/phosphatase (EEP) superfamily protein YafD